MAGRRVMLLKRIIAMPGESVGFSDGRLVIDGEDVPEPYVRKTGHWNMEAVRIGADEFYVAGDNRATAIGSHAHGRVERKRIVGGALF